MTKALQKRLTKLRETLQDVADQLDGIIQDNGDLPEGELLEEAQDRVNDACDVFDAMTALNP